MAAAFGQGGLDLLVIRTSFLELAQIRLTHGLFQRLENSSRTVGRVRGPMQGVVPRHIWQFPDVMIPPSGRNLEPKGLHSGSFEANVPGIEAHDSGAMG